MQGGIDDARGKLLPEDKPSAVDGLLARYGKVALFIAVFADMGDSLLVIFNGLRLLGKRS